MTCHVRLKAINSLAPGRFEWNFRQVNLQGNSNDCWLRYLSWKCPQINITGSGYGLMPSLDFIDDQSTLVQVMAWCPQETSQYLSQCWPRSMSPYGVTSTRPQWVNWDNDKHDLKGEVRQVPTKGWARGVWCMKTNAFRTCGSHYGLNISRLGCGKVKTSTRNLWGIGMIYISKKSHWAVVWVD